MPEIFRFENYVDPSIIEEFRQKLPDPFLLTYEERLHGRKRWGEENPNYGDVSFFTKRPGFSESVFEHSAGMLLMIGDIRKRPSLNSEFDFAVATYMAVGHDAGEIIVGDAPSQGRVRENAFWTKRKEAEHKVALERIIKRIPDPNVRLEMAQYYHRYADQKPHDKEALLTRFLDKAQGTTRVGVDHVFDYRAIGLQKPPDRLVEHIRNNLAIFTDAYFRLHRAISPDAQTELFEFANAEINRLKQIGFEDLAAQAQANLSLIIGH